MRLSIVVEQKKSCIRAFLQKLLHHGDVLNIRVKNIVDDDDILVRLSGLVFIVDHLAADDAEGDGCFFVADDSIEDEGASRDDLRVVCKLG